MTKNNLGLVGYEVLMFLRENLKRNNLGFVGYEFVISGDASAQGQVDKGHINDKHTSKISSGYVEQNINTQCILKIKTNTTSNVDKQIGYKSPFLVPCPHFEYLDIISPFFQMNFWLPKTKQNFAKLCQLKHIHVVLDIHIFCATGW